MTEVTGMMRTLSVYSCLLRIGGNGKCSGPDARTAAVQNISIIQNSEIFSMSCHLECRDVLLYTPNISKPHTVAPFGVVRVTTVSPTRTRARTHHSSPSSCRVIASTNLFQIFLSFFLSIPANVPSLPPLFSSSSLSNQRSSRLQPNHPCH